MTRNKPHRFITTKKPHQMRSNRHQYVVPTREYNGWYTYRIIPKKKDPLDIKLTSSQKKETICIEPDENSTSDYLFWGKSEKEKKRIKKELESREKKPFPLIRKLLIFAKIIDEPTH